MFEELGMPAELQEAIDNCYAVFAFYRPPRRLEAPPYRDPAAILDTLSSAPLRNLTADQLGPYAFWAMTTVGDVDDYRHFLPRILELAISDNSHPGIDPPAIAGKLRYAGCPTWPDKERAAVQAIFAKAWHYGLKQHPDDYDPQRWLNGIALIDGDLDAALAAWLSSPSSNATLQLAEFFRGDVERLFGDRANRNFWQGAGDAVIETMRRWLLSDPVVNRLLAASDTVGSEDEWRIERALLVLSALSPTRPR
jgi:hypothetical protein